VFSFDNKIQSSNSKCGILDSFFSIEQKKKIKINANADTAVAGSFLLPHDVDNCHAMFYTGCSLYKLLNWVVGTLREKNYTHFLLLNSIYFVSRS